RSPRRGSASSRAAPSPARNSRTIASYTSELGSLLLLTRKRHDPFPALASRSHGFALVQDGGGRPPLVPLRRGRPRAPPLHGRARSRGGRGEGRPEDEVPLRRPARAALARRPPAPPGLR